MADKRFTDAIEEKLALIAPTLNTIEFGGEQPYLCELQTLLRQHLISLVVLFERDPGLDAATADLYAAAAAVVNDTTAASQPLARKRRLLKEAQARFQERIATAHPNGRRAGAAWQQSELFLAA
jgi:4-alpha-glucanotransferase